MAKYLEALKLLYGNDEKSCETLKTRTDKTDRSPFASNVSASSRGFHEILPENGENRIPFTDHEIAEHKIDQLTLHKDRAFVRQMLLGAYGRDRLALVNQYFTEWRKGANAEPIEVKKENAGRVHLGKQKRKRNNKPQVAHVTSN